MLMKNLNLKIPKYSPKSDPTKLVAQSPEKFLEWTISDYALKKMKKIYEEKCGTKEAKKRLEMIDDDLPLSVAKNLKRSRVKDDDDSDLEVLDVIVKPKRGGREASKRGQKKNTSGYSQTITVKKVTPPPKKGKYETEKITIKKNVTPTKTKYEIVQPKPKKTPKCEIVYSTEDSDACNDLDMICESDDDEMTNNFTTNFRLYLYDEKDVKKEEAEEKKAETEETTCVKNETKSEETVESEAKEPSKAEEFVKEEDKGVEASEKQAEISLEDAVKEEIKEAEKDEKVEEPSPVVEKPLTNEAVGAETAETGGGSTKTPEEELADYIKSAEMEAEKNSRLEGGESDANGKLNHELDVAIKEAEEKAKDIRSKVESEIDELVNNHRSAQFETIPELSMNQSVNENYGFYNNQYNATSNSTDLEYVDNNYYNSFQ